MFGKIENMGLPDRKSKIEVLKANIFAFQRLSLTHELHKLDKIKTDQDTSALLKLFGTVDELEAYNYYEITKGRLKVIGKFRDVVDEDSKEKVLQDYLFEQPLVT